MVTRLLKHKTGFIQRVDNKTNKTFFRTPPSAIADDVGGVLFLLFFERSPNRTKKRFSGPHLYLTALGGERVQALQAEAEQLLKCSLL